MCKLQLLAEKERRHKLLFLLTVLLKRVWRKLLPIISIAVTRQMLFLPFTFLVLILQL